MLKICVFVIIVILCGFSDAEESTSESTYKSTSESTSEIASESKKVVCYYTNWSQYRMKPVSFYPENIDPFLCSHIIYAFAKLNNEHEIEPFEWNDLSTSWSIGMYDRIMALKKKNADLKILIAVGGWNLGSKIFSEMVHNVTSRKTFVKTTVEFLLANKFNGLDLDWEYPGSRNGSQIDDKGLLTQLVEVRVHK